MVVNKMKYIEELQDKARQRFSFFGSLLIHFILFVILAFSGVFSVKISELSAADIVYFDAGGGGGGGDAAVEDTEVLDEQSKNIIDEEVITVPDSKTEHKKIIPKVTEKVSAETKKGSGTGSGSGYGSGYGVGTGSGEGYGNGSGSGGGRGTGHGTGVGNGSGAGIAVAPKIPPRIISAVTPYYPSALKDAGVSGRAVVRGVIDTEGRVESVELLKSTGNTTLDDNAMNAFRKWRFSPAKNDSGKKVRCYFTQGFPFVIQYR